MAYKPSKQYFKDIIFLIIFSDMCLKIDIAQVYLTPVFCSTDRVQNLFLVQDLDIMLDCMAILYC